LDFWQQHLGMINSINALITSKTPITSQMFQVVKRVTKIRTMPNTSNFIPLHAGVHPSIRITSDAHKSGYQVYKYCEKQKLNNEFPDSMTEAYTTE